MSKLESKRCLRKLELEAHSALITAIRAQGNLTEEKNSFLKESRNIFKISIERHKAELRRASNDKTICKISNRLANSTSNTMALNADKINMKWSKESKRLIPLIPHINSEANTFQRIIADTILTKSKPVLDLCSDEMMSVEERDHENGSSNNSQEFSIKESVKEEKNEIDPKKQQNAAAKCLKPSEFIAKYENQDKTIASNETDSDDLMNRSFLKKLIQKFKQQKNQKQSTKFTNNQNEPDSSKAIPLKQFNNINNNNNGEIIQIITGANQQIFQIEPPQPLIKYEGNNFANNRTAITTENNNNMNKNLNNFPIATYNYTTPVFLNTLSHNKTAKLNNNSNNISSIIQNHLSFASNNNNNNNATTTPTPAHIFSSNTIVKLNPSRISFNKNILKKEPFISSSPNLNKLNGNNICYITNNISSIGANNQQVKQFRVQKPNQNLIILPAASMSHAATLKPNIDQAIACDFLNSSTQTQVQSQKLPSNTIKIASLTNNIQGLK
jgi:hypothetical protein